MNISPQYSNIQLKGLARDVHNASQENVKTFARSSNSLKDPAGHDRDRASVSKSFSSLGSWKPWDGKTAENGSSEGGSVENAGTNSASKASNTNSASRANSSSEAKQGGSSEPTFEQVKAENDNARMTAEAQAKMMAENVKTAENIAKIYAEMWAEVEKSRAERHKIIMDTARAISDIMAKCHENRLATSQANFDSFLAAIIDAPKK